MTNMISEALSKEELIALFKRIGVLNGAILEVHVALSSLPYIIGGAQTFIEALIETVGYNGTILMPLQCGGRSEPSYFQKPPLSFDLHQKFRDHLPAFDPCSSDTYKMSKVSECLRMKKGAIISNHPTCAFVGYGKYARTLLEEVPLSFPFSKTSTLGKLVELKAQCLLVGVDYNNMTSLHLCEYESEVRPILLQGSKIKVNDEEKWVQFLDYALDSEDGFIEIGQRLEKKGLVQKEKIAKGEIKCLRVDYAVAEGIQYYNERMKDYKKW